MKIVSALLFCFSATFDPGEEKYGHLSCDIHYDCSLKAVELFAADGTPSEAEYICLFPKGLTFKWRVIMLHILRIFEMSAF